MALTLDTKQAEFASTLARDLRAVVGKLKRRLRAQSDIGDLTSSQVSVLLRLEKHGPATTSGLARAEGMRPQSMAPVVAALEAQGLEWKQQAHGDYQRLAGSTEAEKQQAQELRSADLRRDPANREFF